MTKADISEFWTWIPKSVTCSGQGITASGWFAYMAITYDETDINKHNPNLKVHYLTPADQPMTFALPMWMVKNKSMEQISAMDIKEVLCALFAKTFRDIPDAPISIPIEKIPPHRREAIRQALKNRSR